jgi:3-oxoacyl-[acyl-carrier protein] reductase
MTSQMLSDRVVLVTGSVRRVGRAILMKMAEAGASVVVNARSNSSEVEALARTIELQYGAGRALVCICDVTDEDSVQRMIRAIIDRFGRLDVLVNNANARQEAESKSITRSEWQTVVQTTLDGAYLCAQAAVPYLGRFGDGRIINIAGVTAHTGSPNHPHVVAAKAGLIGLTRAMATDYGPMGVTVNCISPALIVADDDDPARVARLRKAFPIEKVPLRRAGSVEELAAAATALCGPEWRFMTGQTIHFNGGVYFGS